MRLPSDLTGPAPLVGSSVREGLRGSGVDGRTGGGGYARRNASRCSRPPTTGGGTGLAGADAGDLETEDTGGCPAPRRRCGRGATRGAGVACPDPGAQVPEKGEGDDAAYGYDCAYLFYSLVAYVLCCATGDVVRGFAAAAAALWCGCTRGDAACRGQLRRVAGAGASIRGEEHLECLHDGATTIAATKGRLLAFGTRVVGAARRRGPRGRGPRRRHQRRARQLRTCRGGVGGESRLSPSDGQWSTAQRGCGWPPSHPRGGGAEGRGRRARTPTRSGRCTRALIYLTIACHLPEVVNEAARVRHGHHGDGGHEDRIDM